MVSTVLVLLFFKIGNLLNVQVAAGQSTSRTQCARSTQNGFYRFLVLLYRPHKFYRGPLHDALNNICTISFVSAT